MSQTSGFFNAEQLPDGSYDRVYMAQQFAYYFSKFIGNGVFITPATQLKVVPQDMPSMGVNVLVGDAYINGYWYRNDNVYPLKLSNANGTRERIDLVVLRLDYSLRSIYLKVLEGTPDASPIEPSYSRDSDYYDLVLASIRVGKSVTTITSSVITDKRNDNNVCGYVHGVVSQIDTTDLFSQFTSAFNTWFDDIKNTIDEENYRFTVLFDNWFNTIKGKLEGEVATALQAQIDKLQEQDNKLQEQDNKLQEQVDKLRGKTIVSTLKAGKTSITITDEAITDSCDIDYYTSVYGVNPKTIAVSDKRITLTFKKQTKDISVKVVIK